MIETSRFYASKHRSYLQLELERFGGDIITTFTVYNLDAIRYLLKLQDVMKSRHFSPLRSSHITRSKGAVLFKQERFSVEGLSANSWLRKFDVLQTNISLRRKARGLIYQF